MAVLGGLYRGAVDPTGWTRALDRLTRLFDGELSVVEIRHRRLPEIAIETTSVVLPEKVHEDYNAYYGLICPRAALLRDELPSVVMHDDMLGDAAALDRDEYHVDFLKPQGLRYFIACRLDATPDINIIFSVQRARAAGRATGEVIERFERIVPHLADAYALRLAFGSALARAQAFDWVIDRLAAAVILIDHAGKPVYASRAAESLIAETPGVSLGRDGLAIGDAAARRAYGRALTRALSGAAGGIVDMPGTGLRLRIVPLDAESHLLHSAGVPAAAILVEERKTAGGPGLELARGYGLTRREAEIALLLAQGQSPREIAEAQGLRLSTVRTHVARARTKLEARSIAQLVSVVLSETPRA